MGVLGWVAVAAGAVLLFLVAQLVYLSVVLSWSNERTRGLGYYGLPPEGRAAFKATLRRHARLLRPILSLMGRSSNFTYDRASIRHATYTGPKGTCSEASFARGVAYEPQPEDVFVVTQMKCGTTWMQHVVYQIVERGRGDIVETGRTLYGVAPWLEADTSVPIEQAPLHGAARPTRIIKTHLPVALCPLSPDARYIYVARHPASCFASCADFIATNIGVLAPPLETTERWFCSSEMWWGPWTEHVNGWWQRAQTEPNVLFVRFEDMKRDLPDIVRRVAAFLGVAPLDDTELANVVRKCGFAYMQEHRDAFEMHPPHLLATDAELFVRGTTDRHRDVPDDMRLRILSWCVSELDRSGFPLTETYPEVAAVGTARAAG